ncbi:MAG: low molecular weight protein arginine phosphatase [bacterium]|nr:low molecular weight protein arginine phosphatase [bacterium]
MAEGILKEMVKDLEIRVSSAGTSAIDGMPSSANGVEVCKENDIDISPKRSSYLYEELITEADLVLVMAEEHLEYIKRMYPKYYDKAYLLTRFGREHVDNMIEIDVYDPFGGEIGEYRETFMYIKKEIERIYPLIIDSEQ